MDRRRMMAALAATGFGAALGRVRAAEADARFDFAVVEASAAARAAAPYRREQVTLEGRYARLDYDGFRSITPRIDRALWAGEQRGFVASPLHPGGLYVDAVHVHEVVDGAVQRIVLDPGRFDYGGHPPPTGQQLAHSGLRFNYPINAPGVLDEVAVFQGASYFRAVGRGDFYGLSARGLALDVAEPSGEEFPHFTDLWVTRPERDAAALELFALLDGPSVAGAYRFVIAPGAETVVEVNATLFPRVGLRHVGLAPFSSMFQFDPSDRDGVDDYRSAVHDSNGLQIETGAGERIWRPIANPKILQASAFLDRDPRGFGLEQRTRDFDAFGDSLAFYERRTSCWVEPIGGWGAGAVTLIEIPTATEYVDNIVAYWRPAAEIAAGAPFRFAYRLRWAGRAGEPADLARVVGTRIGPKLPGFSKLFVVDYEGDPTVLGAARIEVSTNAGRVWGPKLGPLPDGRRTRVAFILDHADEPVAELRLRLVGPDDAPVAETWLYRWTA